MDSFERIKGTRFNKKRFDDVIYKMYSLSSTPFDCQQLTYNTALLHIYRIIRRIFHGAFHELLGEMMLIFIYTVALFFNFMEFYASIPYLLLLVCFSTSHSRWEKVIVVRQKVPLSLCRVLLLHLCMRLLWQNGTEIFPAFVPLLYYCGMESETNL
jgi:hypothetical protein